MTKKIVIFGGTFDPIHIGHLFIAEECINKAGADHVIFVPLNQPNYKKNHLIRSPSVRLEMVNLAIGAYPNFSSSDLEIERGGITYTYQTVLDIASMYSQSELFFLVSSEWIPKLHTWKNYEVLCKTVTFIVVDRHEVNPTDLENTIKTLQPHGFEMNLLDAPKFEISSTEIRRRVYNRESINFLVPPDVISYINKHKLYRK